MTTKKHTLTSGKDNIKGVGGADLFQGAPGTLGNNDVLNGGGGIDTIAAELTGKHLSPVMKSIEHGVFTHKGSAKVGLNLVHAQQMTDLTLKDLQADVNVSHATLLDRIVVKNSSDHVVKVSGISVSDFPTQHVAFQNSSNESLELNFQSGEKVQTLDISLKQSKGVSIDGTAETQNLVVHSLGKSANSIDFTSSNLIAGVTDLVAKGSAALNIQTSQAAGFANLVSFDASHMGGALTADFVSTALVSVLGSAGNDTMSLAHLGGTAGAKAVVALGGGNDVLDLRSFALDASTMSIDGGDGSDTVRLSGNPGGALAALTGFETLDLTDSSGTYTLNAGWTGLSLSGANSAFVKSFVTGGTGLTSVIGDAGDQYLELDAIGGSVAHKANVFLGGGIDYVILDNVTLDASTQHYNGGAGHDAVRVQGNVGNLAALFESFEDLFIKDAAGTYDLAGTVFTDFSLNGAPASSVSLINLGSKTLTNINETMTTLLTFDAADSGSTIGIGLYGSNTTVGNATFGVFVDQTADLRVESYFGATTLYLSTLGSQTQAATLSITGETKTTVIAANGSTMYIDTLFINNPAGADILGLSKGNTAFVDSGATISGGNGGDVLVGGVGADTITSGGGNNTIHGSLGIDAVNLSGGGQDMLIFHSQDQSAFNSGDNISGFNIFDAIDISDLVSSVSFSNNVATFNAGVSTLSTNHSVGFFETANNTLYVDVNHDGAIDSAHDMEFHLIGLDIFNSTSLIG